MATASNRKSSGNPRGRPAGTGTADIRSAILDAAETLFAGQGYAATSIREIAAMVDEVIAATGAESIRDMGKVMGQIKAKAAGRADMGAVGAAYAVLVV